MKMHHNTFETKEISVLIENICNTNSAFGVANNGECVFFNARLVSKMNVKVGDVLKAFCVPNYKDKRSKIEWRCISI